MRSTPFSSTSSRLGTGARLVADSGQSVLVRAWRGEGSYARVYQGVLEPTGALCAVKAAKPEIPEAGERLRRERGVLTAVRHPHLVRLLDGGNEGGLPWLALEWLEGETLLDLIAARRRLPLRASLEHLETVLDAAAAIHARGLIHGDIRPQNVIVVAGRGAVLTDPGAEPEATEGDDVRAAGALFHRMLTGVDPAGSPAVLTPAAGYSRAAVQLWERTAGPRLPSARELLGEVRNLRRSL